MTKRMKMIAEDKERQMLGGSYLVNQIIVNAAFFPEKLTR